MVNKRVLKGTEFWVRGIPRSGSEYARAFARPPEGEGPNTGVHFNPGLLLNNSERMAEDLGLPGGWKDKKLSGFGDILS